MRISGYERFQVPMSDFLKLEQQLSKQNIQMASGKQFVKASDDPIGLNRKTLITNAQNQLLQYQENIQDAKSFTETTEGVLSSTIDVLQRVREIGISASNGTYNEKDMKTFKEEVEQAIETVLSYANTKHLDRYIFSGEKTDTEAFTFNGTAVTYQGDNTVQEIRISPYLSTAISGTGADLFQDALTALVNMRDQLDTGVAANISGAIDQMDQAMNHVVDQRSVMGTRLNTMSVLFESFKKTELDLEDKRSGVEDVDLSELSIEFTKTRMMYQATLKTSTTMMQTGLLSFLN